MKTFISCLILISALGTLSACSNQDLGMTAGGVVGGVAGNAITGGSTAGTIVGAVGGGYVGRQLAN